MPEGSDFPLIPFISDRALLISLSVDSGLPPFAGSVEIDPFGPVNASSPRGDNARSDPLAELEELSELAVLCGLYVVTPLAEVTVDDVPSVPELPAEAS